MTQSYCAGIKRGNEKLFSANNLLSFHCKRNANKDSPRKRRDYGYYYIPRLLIFVFLLLIEASFAAEVVINELLAKNDAAVADQSGEYDDWLELYNRGDRPVALRDCYLSDDFDELKKWAFPDTIIRPGSYIVVWADDDEEQPGLHTNFKISASGDALYLVDSNALIIDRVAFGVQSADISLGRFPDGAEEFRRMTPTFAAPNDGAHLGLIDSSGFVFDEPAIHRIDLHFYTANWPELLKYNFETLDKEYAPVRFTFDNAIVLDSVGVRYKGNSSYTLSRHTPKKPFKFRFDKYKECQTLYDLLKLNLSNGISDPTFMREYIAYSIARRYLPAPRVNYANLYIEGVHIGFYVLVEQIDTQFLQRYFDDHTFNLYKATNTGAAMAYRGINKSDYSSEFRLRTNRDEDDWTGLLELLDKLNNTPRRTFLETMSISLHLDQCLRFLAFNMILSNFDSYTGSGRNFYLYDDHCTGQFNIIPWDPNEAFGVFRNNWNVITQDIDVPSNLAQRPLIKKLLENDSLKHKYWAYIREMIEGPAAFDAVSAMASNLYRMIETSVRNDENKLYGYQYFLNNIEGEVQLELGRTIPGLKSFVQDRNTAILAQLAQEKVYPGDADNNGVVDEFDILPIGIYFLNTGRPRLYSTYAWSAQRANLWAVSAATYADVNGDGQVNAKDIVGIGLNWRNTHRQASPSYEIDPADAVLLKSYESNFKLIYNSLNSQDASISAMKALLGRFIDLAEPLPGDYILCQNYPNPFNSSTTIGFYLPSEQNVSLSVHNLRGQTLLIPIDGQVLKPGHHGCYFSAAELPGGIYFYRLTTPTSAVVRMMTVGR